MKTIYIVIINYDGADNTRDCLDSLLKLETSGFRVNTLVIDNYPKNPIKIDTKKYKKINLEIIYNSKNLGFSGGNNIGISKALKEGTDYVLVLNNDTVVKEDFLEEMFEYAEKNENIGIIAPKIYFAKGYEYHKERYSKEELGKVIWYAGGIMDWRNVIGHHVGVDEIDHGQFGETLETDFASGCCMFIRKQVLEKVGLLDDNYFLYYEDSDLSERVKGAGFKICFLPDSIIWHKNAGSTGGPGSDLQDYYITRNRLLFGSKYASIRAKIALVRQGLRLTVKGRKMQKYGARDFFLRNFGKSKYI